jgi:hypothetical protein
MDEDQKDQETENAGSETATSILTAPFPGTFVYSNATAFSMTFTSVQGRRSPLVYIGCLPL